MSTPTDFATLWARAGLEALSSAPTVLATLSARTLSAAVADTVVSSDLGAFPLGSAQTVSAGADVALRLSPKLSDTLPTLPALDLVPRESADGDKAELAIVGLLGEGGMGRVLVARQRSLAREVAVKVRKPGVPAQAAVALLSEARIMGHLEHPSIVPVHALGRDADGSPVIVMKRIDGCEWSTLLAEPEHPAWSKLTTLSRDRTTAHLEILVAVCNAVQFANTRGIVHRDLKPDNVMVGEFGEVYVTDWGIALAVAGVAQAEPDSFMIVGTPAYMAPEMVHGDPRLVDARTDVYLLGAIVHEILTGEQRNPGETLREVVRSAYLPVPVVYDDTVPEELAAIANQATSAQPAARHPDVQALQRAIVEYLHHRGSIALCEAAQASLEQLSRALGAPPRERTGDQSGLVERLATECRFGFLQALRGWPENRQAAFGLRECVVRLVSDRIAGGDARAARSLLAELDSPPGELVAQLEALEAEVARAAREHEALAASARDMDPSVGAGERTKFLVIGLIASMVVVLMILGADPGSGALELRKLVLVPAVLLVLALLGFAIQARRPTSRFNRRAATLVVVALAMLVLHRLLGVHAGDALGSVLRGDALILAAVFLSAAATQQRVLAFAALPLLAVAALLPQGARAQVATFGLAITLSGVLATLGSVWISKEK